MDSAKNIVASIKTRRTSAAETLQACLVKIKNRDPGIRAFTALNEDQAAARAVKIDAEIDRGDDAGMLAGLPVAIKANICAKGMVTSCCSNMLEHFIPPYDAHVVERLEAHGAVIVGSTNMDEFAMGSSTEYSAFFPTLNPLSPSHVPGGSSGGAAAAVAAGMTPVAVGSDTAGSIRQPASFCGLVGIKPTYGLVSRRGLVAFASSFDQIGPIAGSVEDAFFLLKAIAGKDEKDATSLDLPAGFFDFLDRDAEACTRSAQDYVLGVPDDSTLDGCDSEVLRLFRSSVETLAARGMRIETIRLTTLPYCVASYYIISPAETSSNLARYDGVRYGLKVDGHTFREMVRRTRDRGFGSEVKRRIMIGTFVLSSGFYEEYYLKAQKVRTVIINELMDTFKNIDAILLPTSPFPPFRLNEKTDDPLAMYLADAYTTPASLAGIPAISIPCGSTQGGLPVGLQAMTPALGEERLFNLSLLMETVLGLAKK